MKEEQNRGKKTKQKQNEYNKNTVKISASADGRSKHDSTRLVGTWFCSYSCLRRVESIILVYYGVRAQYLYTYIIRISFKVPTLRYTVRLPAVELCLSYELLREYLYVDSYSYIGNTYNDYYTWYEDE